MYPEKLILGIGDLWPRFENPGPYTFSLYVAGDFARKCRAESIDPKVIGRFNEMGANLIKSVLGWRNPSPYQFVEGSLLLAQCGLGNEGRWLSADTRRFNHRKGELLEYVGHNIDSAHQAYALMSLMSLWASHADALLSQ